jgi:hypothetical protein
MKYLKFIIFAGFALRLLYAARIGYVGAADGLDMDAEGFYMRMVIIARTGIFEGMRVGEPLVLNSVGTLMGFLGDDVFIACLFSCLAWLVSGLFFAGSARLMDGDDRLKVAAILLYSFWPTAIPYTTITLREPYQLMFASMALYTAMCLFRTRSPIFWPILIVGLTGMGSLHGGLTAFAVTLLMLTAIFYTLFGGARFSAASVAMSAIFAIVVGYVGISSFSSLGYNIEGGILESAQTYQGYGANIFGRTNYKEEVQSVEGIGGVLFVPVGLLQYLFEPMPWRISALVDVILFFENIVRFLIIALALIELVKSPKHAQRTLLLFLLLAYLAQELLWSLGTVNWGTASRHHVPAMGLLLLTGMQALFLRNARLAGRKWQARMVSAA